MHHRMYLKILVLALCLLPLQLSATATPEPSARIVLFADGQLQRVALQGGQVQEALDQAGVSLETGDRLFANGMPVEADSPLPVADPLVLQVERAVELTLDGESLSTVSPSLAGAYWETGTRLRISDALSSPAGLPPAPALIVERTPSRRIVVTVGGEEVTTRTAAGTVGEALQAAGLALQGLDTSSPAPDAPLPADGQIRVVRVEEEILLEQTSFSFDTLTQPAPDLEIDSTQVLQVGQFGLQASRVRIRYEDGVEVSRVTEAEWVAVEPKPRILGYGTKIVVRTLNTPGGAVEYWRAVPAFATSYSPCRLGIDTCGNTTASGLPLKKGVVGVIRSWYNAMVFSEVYVEGYGVGVIADIGAGVSGQHWIDLGYSDDDWQQWAGNVTIYFLTPIPPADQILWILP